MAPVVSAVRSAGRGRVAVELDGIPWRVLTAEAVVAAGLETGVALDRIRARRLRTELRRVEARGAALVALRYRDHTVATLDRRLGARGVAPVDREAAITTMERAGLVDDARFAATRALALAGRGAGDLLIRDDLLKRGVSAELIDGAIAALEPESERAQRILASAGGSLRMLRRLAAKGFAEETLHDLVAEEGETELG